MPTAAPHLDQQLTIQRQRLVRRLHRVYAAYRVGIGAAVFVTYYLGLSSTLGSVAHDTFQWLAFAYLSANALLALATWLTPEQHFENTTLALVVAAIDIITIIWMTHLSGGTNSGLAMVAVVSIGAGAILLPPRLSLFLPALATLAVLLSTIALNIQKEAQAPYFQAGVLGAIYFTSSLVVTYLSARLRQSELESLARAVEVKDLERLSELVIQRMQTGILVSSHDGRVRLVNQAAGRLLGISTELLGKTLPGPLRRRFDIWRDDVQQRSGIFQLGSAISDIRASFSEVRPGTDSDIIVFLEDQAELQQQAQQLKLAGLGRLSASIAHEIRNPLGAVSHAAQLLAESDALDPADRRLADIIQTHCRRLNEVVGNVLELSRRRSPSPERIQIGDWLANFLEEFKDTRTDLPDIKITGAIGVGQVVMDPGHLRQVLTNLIDNALRHARPSDTQCGVEINLGEDALSERPYLTVSDNGAGVAPDKIPSLFEPFFTTALNGTGLGLYICRELCEANQARLSYSPNEIGGASFRISFRHPQRSTASGDMERSGTFSAMSLQSAT